MELNIINRSQELYHSNPGKFWKIQGFLYELGKYAQYNAGPAPLVRLVNGKSVGIRGLSQWEIGWNQGIKSMNGKSVGIRGLSQ